MDYTTSYVFLMVSLSLFTAALFSLSLVDRRVVGARWLASATLLELVKTVLQSLEGRLPRIATVMTANELNVATFFAMYMGFRWFVVRRPLKSWVGPAALLAMMAMYAEMFMRRSPWSFAIMSVPVLWMCGAMVWMMLTQREERFRIPAGILAVLLILQIAVLSYRMELSVTARIAGHLDSTPWADARWMYSMLAIMLVGYCLLLMYLLFTAVEMYHNVARVAGLDALTGSLNRGALLKHVGLELERSERLGRPLSIVGMDLDHFKRVNDTHGHGAGDATLCAFVSLVKDRLRSDDVVARTGGEEFVLVLPDMDASTAALVAERLRRDVEEMQVEYDGRLISTTVSAGVTEKLEPSDSWAEMVLRADRSLYQAKSEGRNRVVLDEQVAMRPKPMGVERFSGPSEAEPKAASAL